MKDKFVIFALVLVLLLSCSGGVSAHAAEEVYTFEQWCEDNGYVCAASSNHWTGDDAKYDFVYDSSKLYFVLELGHGTFLYQYDDVGQFFYNDSDSVRMILSGSDDSLIAVNEKTFKYEDDGWTYTNMGSHKISSTTSSYTFGIDIVFSCRDIYSDVNKTDVFFPQTPLPLEPTLPEIVQEVELKTALTQILGLIPLLVVLIISWVALRKGLAMLYRALRKA